MMRTIEVAIIIIIISGAFIAASYFAVLPSPQQVSPLNLRRLALTTLETLDTNYELSKTVFKSELDPAWGQLQIALSAALPPDIVYNLTVYDVALNESTLYTPIKSLSNAESLGLEADVGYYLVASSNVTFNVVAEKIGEQGEGGTLYILNCSDANGWWITGYTAQSLAKDLYNLLSPYFQRTIIIQNTTQLGLLLNGTSLQSETVQNAVFINTYGESLPIPSGYYASPGVGYDSAQSSYVKYCYTLGQRVRQYNWTWVSIVGYPLYYVSNTDLFPNEQNTWGIYGMERVGPAGLTAFLQGIDNQSYSYDSEWITGSPGVVYLSQEVKHYCNYYGIYPSYYQTATRALPTSILNDYNFTIATYVFNQVDNWIPGAIYNHIFSNDKEVSGSLFSLGLTRTPDIRITTIGLLSYYSPRLFRSEFTVPGTSRLVMLRLGKVGGS